MKVRLIRRETIEEYARHNAQSRVSFTEWLAKIKYADWNEPEDMQATFRSTDFLGNGSSRVVFDRTIYCKHLLNKRHGNTQI